MGKIVRQGVAYCGSSDSATSIKYDNTKNVKEAIDEIKNTAMFIDSFDTNTGALNTTSETSPSGGGSSSSNQTAVSVIFDNTDTGLAATNVQDAVEEVNGKLNIRYNADTDTVQILYNGTWVDWKSGEQTDIPLFVAGQGNVNTDISGGFTKTSGAYSGTVNIDAIVMSTTNATNSSGTYTVVIGSGKLIDRTVYKKIKFHAVVSGSDSNNAYANLNTAKSNYGERLAPKDGYHRIVTGDNILDISEAASNGYICFFLGVNSGTVSVTIDSIVLEK